MAGFCSRRTLCTTGCLMVALLAGGSVRAISFNAIEVPDNRWNQFANVLSISADGSRLGGIIVMPHVEHDCASFICAGGGFDWSLPGELQITHSLGPTGSTNLSRTLDVAPGLALAQSGSLQSFAITPSGVVAFEELIGAPGYGTSVSDDGQTVTGIMGTPLSDGSVAFLWKAGSGVLQFELPGRTSGHNLISGDGAVVVGAVRDAEWTRTDLVRWSESSGVEVLENSVGNGRFNQPQVVNYDGSVIVGKGYDSGTPLPFIWTASDGTQQLPLSPPMEK